MNFDDFFDSTPEKEDPDVEILQQRTKPKKKSVRKVFHDVNTAKAAANAKAKKDSASKRMPGHTREKRAISNNADLNKSYIAFSNTELKFAPSIRNFTTEEKSNTVLEYGPKVIIHKKAT